MTNLRQIHVTRATCNECNLDKMIVFYRLPNGTPSEMHRAHKKELRRRFKEKYNCEHKITFRREIDKDYMWDLDKQQPVKRGDLQ